MNIIECIKSRRSIRRFTNQPIPDKVLVELLEAVRWAPSWANTQCWEVIIIKAEEKKKRLAELISENNPATRAVLEAPLVMVFCARKGVSGYKKGVLATNKGEWYMFDLGIACEHFCLAAHEKGLGTVHIGGINHQAIGELLGIPEGVEIVELIPVGYPAKIGNAPPRRELSEFIFMERYGGKLVSK